MRVETALKIRNRAVESVNSLSWHAHEFGLAHDDINKRYGVILESLAKTPAWVRYYVDGYMQAQRDSWYRNHIVWAHKSPDGIFYTAHKEIPTWAESVDLIYKSGRGCEIGLWESNHYWKNGMIFF